MNKWDKDYVNPLIGKKIVGVFKSDGDEQLKFTVENGDPVFATTEGDCCSRTWIEALDNVPGIIGGTVTAVEDIDMPGEDYDEKEYECLRFYGARITTDKGVCVIDYRNSSNGYYGGSMDWDDHDPWNRVTTNDEKWKALAD